MDDHQILRVLEDMERRLNSPLTSTAAMATGEEAYQESLAVHLATTILFRNWYHNFYG